MLFLAVLTVLSAQATPCPVQLDAAILDSSALTGDEFRDALKAELGRDVVLGREAHCDQVAIAVDVGVVTITVRARGSDGNKRLLTRSPTTQVVRESVLLAAGLLRGQLDEHLRELVPVPAPPPAPAVEQPAEIETPRWWVNAGGTFGITGMGIVVAGIEAQGQRRFGWVRAGLAVSYTLGIESRQPSSRFQVFPEAGVYGGPARLRLGLFLGLGALLFHEEDARPQSTVHAALAFRPRVSIAVSLSPDLDLQLGGGITLALDPGGLPRHFLFGALGIAYGVL